MLLLPAIAALAAFATPHAKASQPGQGAIGVVWKAPPECPSARDVAGQLGALSGEAVVLSPRPDLVVWGHVRAVAGGFSLELELEAHEKRQTRVLWSSQCDTLGAAAALVASVDFGRFLRSTTPAEVEARPAPLAGPEPEQPPPPVFLGELEPEPEPEPEPAVVAPTVFEPRFVRAPRQRSAIFARARHRFIGSVATGLSLGFAPEATAVVLGRLGWRFGPIEIDATGFHHFAQSRTVFDSASISAAVSGAGLRGCGIIPAGPLEVPICAGFSLGSLHTKPSADLDRGVANDDLWAGAELGAGLAWPVRKRFALVLEAAGTIALRRPGVHWTVLGERREAFRSPLLGFSAVVGPQLRLP